MSRNLVLNLNRRTLCRAMASALGDLQRLRRVIVDYKSRGVERAAEKAVRVLELEIQAASVGLAARA